MPEPQSNAAKEVSVANSEHSAPVLLKNRAVISVKGAEAGHFLENLLTSNLPSKGEAQWWALLSPQGKIQAEGQLIASDHQHFYLETDAGIAPNFFKRLKMYRLRAKIDLTFEEDLVLGWLAPDGQLETQSQDLSASGTDARAGGFGTWVIASKDAASKWNTPEYIFARARIKNGIATIGEDFAVDTLFPHDIGMDQLNGVDFKKGCYVGQEVVSRMQHRGTARRRPVIVSAIENTDERQVLVNAKSVGEIGSVEDGSAIAFLRIDKISSDASATLANQNVMLALPHWAGYGFSDSAK